MFCLVVPLGNDGHDPSFAGSHWSDVEGRRRGRYASTQFVFIRSAALAFLPSSEVGVRFGGRGSGIGTTPASLIELSTLQAGLTSAGDVHPPVPLSIPLPLSRSVPRVFLFILRV